MSEKLPSILETPDEPIGGKKYIHKQIMEWVLTKKEFDFANMTNLAKSVRESLPLSYKLDTLSVLNSQQDQIDKTAKFLFALEDGVQVESVYIPAKGHATACLSSQGGCACKCVFCATGKAGPGRNLHWTEIVMQFLKMEKMLDTTISHIVFMGMGEPMHNYDNVVKAVNFFENSLLNLSARRITVSTIGFPKMIRRWADEGVRSELAVSLHSADEQKRAELIPFKGLSTIAELLASVKYHFEVTGRLPTFEYVLIKDKNDSLDDAKKMVSLLKSFPCKINLIGMNGQIDDCTRPTKASIDGFMNHLTNNGLKATLRRSAGRQIFAACGQLRGNGASNLASNV